MKSIYIHIPFCVKKCRYCAFNSYDDRFYLTDDYFDALLRHIESLEREKIETVYIGGGTPSAVDEKYILRLTDKIFNHFDVEKGAEITIEANPKTVTKEKIVSYKNCGINRISIGAQSFDDRSLAILGRIHTAEDIENTVYLAKDNGIENVNIDIMYAIGGQTRKSLETTLEKAMALNTEHISLYGLSAEEGTPFCSDVKNGAASLFSDDDYADMYEYICAFLKENGFVHYEISNFAKSEKFVSRHNLKYWHGGEYFGVGAGASGYVSGRRFTNNEKIEDYIKNPTEQKDVQIIDKCAKMSEYIILNLRLLQDGISISGFKKRFGEDIFSLFGEKLKFHLEKTKMLKLRGDKILLSEKAYYVCNAVMCDFV